MLIFTEYPYLRFLLEVIHKDAGGLAEPLAHREGDLLKHLYSHIRLLFQEPVQIIFRQRNKDRVGRGNGGGGARVAVDHRGK